MKVCRVHGEWVRAIRFIINDVSAPECAGSPNGGL